MSTRLPKNERNTEQLIHDELRANGYYEPDATTVVEHQVSSIAAIKKAMANASKTGGMGGGKPEEFITSTDEPDFVVVMEAKASTSDHISPLVVQLLDGTYNEDEADAATILGNAKLKQRYAADGALHYARALSKTHNVIAVAVSGETKSAMKVTSYLWPKGARKPKVLTTKEGKPIESIVAWRDYVDSATYDPSVQRLRYEELMVFSRSLHKFMREKASLDENDKPLVVSGTLIALQNRAFAAGYDEYTTPAALQKDWMRVIKDEIDAADIPNAKKEYMAQPYSTIAVHAGLRKPIKGYPKGALHEVIRQLNENVWPYMSVLHDFDVVGSFYSEFLRYSGGDGKGLGIVLTPRHITELFALLANVKKDSTILDICAGTGGFLISGMYQMFKDASTEEERERIRAEGLVGVEQNPRMYALCASNMVLRGDGKANLYLEDSLDPKLTKRLKAHEADVGLLNPPYSQKSPGLEELSFVKRMLDLLKPGGVGIALLPMSTALTPDPLRAELMQHHTLEAVMSLPDQLFNPGAATVPCIMVWRAHKPHASTAKKTWLGYWKDDGFVKVKHKGRVDVGERWSGIRDRWVDMYRNNEVHAGESVLRMLGPDDEWCAEAYMETDYSAIQPANFEKVVKDYAIFRLLGPSVTGEEDDEGEGEDTVEEASE